MPKRLYISLLALTALLLVTAGTAVVAAGGEGRDWRSWLRVMPNIAPASHPAYIEECGSCHLAYPPGVLPAESWSRILAPEALADHYGDDAWLPEALVAELRAYLMSNAADGSARIRERAFAVPGEGQSESSLPRITETPYFVRKHNGIPARLVTDNPEVGSFSQCNRCHIGADTGVFDESQIDIQGFGPWKD